MCPELLIVEWEKIIQKDCLEVEGELDTAVASLYMQLTSISETMKEISDKINGMVVKNASLSSQVQSLYAQNTQFQL